MPSICWAPRSDARPSSASSMSSTDRRRFSPRGLAAAVAAVSFTYAATGSEQAALARRSRWRRPLVAVIALAIAIPLNAGSRFGLRPVMVKDAIETGWLSRTERWNSYSRVVAYRPVLTTPQLWSPSPTTPKTPQVQHAYLNIDGAAGTTMPHFDGTNASIEFLKYDLVNLAYHLPNIDRSAVIGVGGGRDVLAAHLFGVKTITGVELNRIFVDLHLRDPFYSSFSNLRAVPGLTLHVDDARSWFAATDQTFDLIQMSMIDTWAATSAGAFTLSENGLYTLEGWRAFTRRLTDRGVFTVSRWYNPGDVNESGRMIALAVGTMIDAGAADPRRHVFVATGGNIATLVLATRTVDRGAVDGASRRDGTIGLRRSGRSGSGPAIRRAARAGHGHRSRSARPGRRVGVARSDGPDRPTSFLLQSAALSKHSGGAAAAGAQ